MPPDQENQEESRRDQISAMFDQAEQAGNEEATGQRTRDEAGRFAPAPAAEEAPVEAAQPETPVVAPVEAVPVAAPAPAPTLTTWRKEMMPLHEKLAAGVALTPEEAKKLADYNVQREREYSTGISTYKAEAQQSRQITDVMQEFMPALQQSGLAPAQWIQNMGRTHAQLVYGSPETKLQIFANLAQTYGVPLGAVQQAQEGQIDPNITALMGQLQAVQKQVGQVTNWHQQQQQQSMEQQLAKFADQSQFPHFEQVRGVMAQLLESGAAQNLDDAYTKAVRVDDTAWQAEQQRQAATAAAAQQRQSAVAVGKAKAAAGQVRSAAPSSAATAPPSAKDRRATLAAAFADADSGRV